MKWSGRRPTRRLLAVLAAFVVHASACTSLVGVGDLGFVKDDAGAGGKDASDGGSDSTTRRDANADADAHPACETGSTRCSDGGVETCAGGEWSAPVACATNSCAPADGGSGATCTGSTMTGTSCEEGGAGVRTCGLGDSCCTSLEVAGGTFYRTYANGGDGGPSSEANLARVSGLRIDKYLVTVGRFRHFVSAWNGGAGYMPPALSGKHKHLNDGKGLVNGEDLGEYEPGWATSDDSSIAPTDTNLETCGANSTWTADAGAHEALPINCVDWAEAYAFCIWDGGFLPSEAEWEYVAAGGSAQREFAWGNTTPGPRNEYAIYGDGMGNCYYPSGSPTPCNGAASIAPVGYASMGGSLWGQLDMGGEVSEWGIDWYASYANPCTDCANLEPTSSRVTRGGNFTDDATTLVPSSRGSLPPNQRGNRGVGIRCARPP